MSGLNLPKQPPPRPPGFIDKPVKGSGANERKARNPAPPKVNNEKMPVDGGFSEGQKSRIMERDGFACLMCGFGAADGRKLEADHVLPRAQGGRSVEENGACLCQKCNRSKGARRLKLLELIVKRHIAHLEGKPNRVLEVPPIQEQIQRAKARTTD